ncbi:MAE_28990/MAE_18760 family HEPN-like nuclease [Levilactobacillus brevis]|uniref:MAE_28990/MAE_18760 family HEPN-like nuclease n=1 Tax=Levilactobacillus brevis TaxID=1580 RepID=UPI001BAD737D|nr:MAE_28990/MAE_18760 family HEPN-like nuclease [Levilactobacillus brevis]MBS0977423.1 hypothetical protein [Levilactobacillus brevis]
MTDNLLEMQYSKRLNEIKTMMDFIDRMLLLPRLTPTFQMSLNIQKSSTALLIYNLMESTVSTSFTNILDSIVDNNVSYADVSEPFQEIWLDLNFMDTFDVSSSFTSYRNRTQKIITKILNNKSTNFLSFSNSVTQWQLPGGNIDAEQINKLCKSFGISFKVPIEISRDAGVLKTIKDKRNQLGHGDYSFDEIGRSITVEDLRSWTNEVDEYLKCLISAITVFIDNRKYCLFPENLITQ